MAGGMSPPNAIHGFDFAGVVVAVGEDLANPERKVGELVAGMVHGGSAADKGSFAGTSLPCSREDRVHLT